MDRLFISKNYDGYVSTEQPIILFLLDLALNSDTTLN